jgi:hypothetical protein
MFLLEEFIMYYPYCPLVWLDLYFLCPSFPILPNNVDTLSCNSLENMCIYALDFDLSGGSVLPAVLAAIPI